MQAGFFHDHAQGWHWYESQSFKDEKKPLVKKMKKHHQPSASIRLLQFKQELKRRLDQALMSPTVAHLKSYMSLQKAMMDRAQKFGTTWMEVVYRHPELDYTATHPVNQAGIFTAAASKKKTIERKIQALSHTHGLFFFFKGDCDYCHAFAPIVKSFSQKYGWHVLAISMDGSTLKDFPDALRDNGAAERLHVTHFPTLLAVHPKDQTVIPISYGLTSHDQMEERILHLSQGSFHAQ